MRRPAAFSLILAFSLLWTGAVAHAATDLLPDLVAEAPTNAQPLQVERPGDGRDHLLLRFDGSIHNIGPGPLEIRGSRPANGLMTVTGQRIYRTDSTFRDDNSRRPQIRFENSDGHRHWHLQGAARYSLWNEAGTVQAAPASKVGFCLLDSQSVDSFAAPRVYTRSATQYCKEGQATAPQVFEGISSGWLDYYPFDLPFQWIDVSDVAPGRYRLGADVDPDNFILEQNEANNGPALASALVTVPGYVASPVTSTGGGARTIGLGAQQFGSPGPAVFSIDSAPAHGTLSATAGAPLAAPQVIYTPRPGFAGTDAFTYSVRDASSPYPLRPRAAVVSVAVPGAGPAASRTHLLTGLSFRRRGRILRVRARSARSGVLRISIRKGKRRLGSCRRRALSGHRFRCRIRLRRHASLSRSRAVVALSVNGKRAAVETYRVRLRGRT